MAIFDRIRRSRTSEPATAAPLSAPVPAHLLPTINQRVTISHAAGSPVPSRVEDVDAGRIQLAYPALELEFGDTVVVSWEHEDTWVTLETLVTGLDRRAAVPTMLVAAGGRISRFDERRRDVRRSVDMPITLRVLRSRALSPGRDLQTTVTEVTGTDLRFQSTAPFAPGDLLEARIRLGEGSEDEVGARVRVVRVDTLPDTWRSSCVVTVDEMLRSDRARLLAVADATGLVIDGNHRRDAQATTASRSTAPTLDGVGGRDEPSGTSDYHGVLDWLRRRD